MQGFTQICFCHGRASAALLTGSYLIIALRVIAAKCSHELAAANTGNQRHVNKFARFGTTVAAAESERGVVAKPASESYGSLEHGKS